MTALRVVAGESLGERVAAAAAVASEQADAVDAESSFPHAAVAELKARRLLGIAAPRELGGEGASLGEIASICADLAAACSSTGMIFAMHQINMANLIDCAGENGWHRELIARAAREQLLFASATTEAGVGGDLRHSICAIERENERFTLAKAAPVISFGEYADALFVTARRDPEAPSSDQVLAIVLRDQCSLERVATWDALGMRGTCSHGYRLKATAPAEQILPKPFADIAAESMVAVSHLLWSSVWCGVAAEALARAQAYAKSSGGSAPPPGAARLADAFAALQMLKALIRDRLREWEACAGAPTLSVSTAVNALKVSASTTALNIVEEAMMICGLHGYRNGGPYSLGRHLRDIHSARLMIGNDRILANTGVMLLMQRRAPASAGL